jgi:hypothetical protein
MSPKSIEIDVSANADADDCLADAAERYVADHPEVAGYDLAPRWTDDERETVTLTVPRWAEIGDADDIAEQRRAMPRRWVR